MKKLALLIFLLSGLLLAGEIRLLDQNASDPAYQMPLKKYPKWICEAKLKNGKTIQFISVKSMMQIYQNQDYFKKHKLLDADIDAIYIQDFISGNRVDAAKAVYVFGSRIAGPHGDDLIPFASEDNAKLFMMKNGGTKILPFKKLSKGLIRYLDM
jgi:nitrous oxide reductase accessory protein NosL